MTFLPPILRAAQQVLDAYRPEGGYLRKDADPTRTLRGLERFRALSGADALGGIRQTFEDERTGLLLAVQLHEAWGDAIEPVLAQSRAAWRTVLASLYARVGLRMALRTWDQSGRVPRDEAWADEITLWVQRHLTEHVASIVDTSREQVTAAIRELPPDGDWRTAIHRLYDEHVLPQRAPLITQTEVIAASGLGAHVAASAAHQQGLRTTRMWHSQLDGRERPAHGDASGQRREMDEAYVVGGERLMFPGDPSLGASAGMLIGCRCYETFEVAA